MYKTSEKYKNKILNSIQYLKIKFNNIDVDDNYILSFKMYCDAFNNKEFVLGSTYKKQLEIEVHKNALENISNIDFKITCIVGLQEEQIPLGDFNILAIEDDENKVKIKAVDYMHKFEGNYDGSEIINNNNNKITLGKLLKDICDKNGVELATPNFMNDMSEISVYDSTISARKYIEYIAELAGGYAVIGRDNKLYIKDYAADNKIMIDINLFKDFVWGQTFKFSKVSYEDGKQDYKIGNDTEKTLYINSNNPFIVEKQQIENIYNKMNSFELTSFEGSTIIDPAIDYGDILLIEGKSIICLGTIEYGGKYSIDIKSKIEPKKEAESMQTKESNNTKIRKIKSEINQQEGYIQTIISETNKNTEKISENYTKILQNINQIINSVQNSSGANLIKNSVMFALDENSEPINWEHGEGGKISTVSDTESLKVGAVSGYSFILNGGRKESQKVIVVKDSEKIPENQKKYYSFGCRIKKASAGEGYIKIYNTVEEYIKRFEVGETAYYEEIKFEELLPKDNYYIVEFYGTVDVLFTDVIMTTGKYKAEWQQANGEIMNTQVNIDINGVTVKSETYKGDYTVMSPLEFAGYSNINGSITKIFTLNKDMTEVYKLFAKKEITMPPLKIVPIMYGEKAGWHFVKSTFGGDDNGNEW